MRMFSFAVLTLFAVLCQPQTFAQVSGAPTVPNRVVGTINPAQRVTLKGNVPSLAKGAVDKGPAPAATPTGRVSLILRPSATQQQALTQFLSDVQNRSSASYHKWMTPAQFGAAFGISDADLAAVESWLQSQGFRIERVPKAHNAIEFSGTIGQIYRAFHTSIHVFSIHGKTHLANVQDPQIPAALAPVVAGVGPLNDFFPRPTVIQGPRGTYNPKTHQITPDPDLTLFSGTTPYLAVGPADAATIYNLPSSTLNANFSGSSAYDGTGIAIGIVGVSSLTMRDVTNYRIAFLKETADTANLPTVIVDGTDPGLNGGGVEALLDNEVAGGIAPNATIYYYTSANSSLSSGLFNAIFRAVDDNAVSILSISFGACEAAFGQSGNMLVNDLTEQAAAQGISVTVSSGDNGPAGCDDFNTESTASYGMAVNALASPPYVTAVGGTDFDVLRTSFSTYANTASSGNWPYYRTALQYIPEKPWNDSTSVNGDYANNTPYLGSQGLGNIVAGSGGKSSVYDKPPYQTALTPSDTKRDLPDVSLLAGDGLYQAFWVLCGDSQTYGITSTNFLDCQTTNGQLTSSSSLSGAGGTSASAPAFAGILALVAQARGSASDNYRLGQVNNILYDLAQTKYAAVFHDVTEGNNAVACSWYSSDCGTNAFTNGYNAKTGYDLASGLGSVDGTALINNWDSVALGPTSTTLTINGTTADYTGVHGAPLQFTVNVTPSTSTGSVAIIDDAGGATGGVQNNGQFAIPLISGTGSASYNGLPGGTYTVWARYGGDTANDTSVSTPPVNVTITPEDSSTYLAVRAYDALTGAPISGSSFPYGSNLFADAQVLGAAEASNTQGLATGSVSFGDGTNTFGTATLGSSNVATWPQPYTGYGLLPGGNHSLVANYQDDASYNASSSAPVMVTIMPLATSVYVTDPGFPLTAGNSFTSYFRVDTTWNAGVPPTGTVTYSEGNTVLASTSTLYPLKDIYPSGGSDYASGSVSISSSQLVAGLNTITVSYGGDTNYNPSSGTIVVDNVASGGGFTFTMPDPVVMSPGDTVPVKLTLSSAGSYTGFQNWSCSTTPTGLISDCGAGETHVSLSDPVDTFFYFTTLTTDAPGDYSVTLAGEDSRTTAVAASTTAGFTLNANPTPALTVVNDGALHVTAGSSTANTTYVAVIGSGGLSGDVNLVCDVSTSISNPASMPTCTVASPVTLATGSPAMAQVTVNTTASTTAGKYNVTVTATSVSDTGVTATDVVPLTVESSPAFAITTGGTISLTAGDSSNNTVPFTLTSLNGFSGTVELRCIMNTVSVTYVSQTYTGCDAPTSVNLTNGGTATVPVSITSSWNSPYGWWTVTLVALDTNSTNYGIDSTANLMLDAAPPPSFKLTNSGDIHVNAGATAGNTSTIQLEPISGYTGYVDLSCTVSTAIVNPLHVPHCSLASYHLDTYNTADEQTVLTIDTTAPSTSSRTPGPAPFGLVTGVTTLAMVFLFGIAGKRRAWIRMLVLLVFVAWAGTIGCGGGGATSGSGGGSSSPGTTPGTYTVTVFGADSPNGVLNAKTTVTVIVK